MSGSSSSPQCILFPSTALAPPRKQLRARFPLLSGSSLVLLGVSVTTARHGRCWGSEVHPERGGVGGGEVGIRVEKKKGGRSLQKSSGGKARAVKMFADVSWERGWFYWSPDGDMSLIGLDGWWMAPSQMGMWQGSLEVFCEAVLNNKSSLPTKKKRGLDLHSPNTVASPSSIMAFNTFLYTPKLQINIHTDNCLFCHLWF